MANPQRGEVVLKVKDREYTLVLDLAAICQLEELFSTSRDGITTFPEIVGAVLRMSYRHIRGMLWAALRRHHPQVSIADVTQMIVDAGGVDAILGQVEALRSTTQPDPQDAEAVGVRP